MQYCRSGNTVVLRIDRGEEITECIKNVAEQENVVCAAVSAIGAVDGFDAGIYDVSSKSYKSKTYEGSYEIVALTGSVTLRNGQPYLHMHICCAGEDGVCVGGHLSRARVSVTCEVFMFMQDCVVERGADEITGINVMRFPQRQN